MKKLTLLLTALCLTVGLTGCETYPDGSVHSYGCNRGGPNYGAAALGAVAGGLLGSVVGGGTGQAIAVGVGAAGGGLLGSQSRIGC